MSREFRRLARTIAHAAIAFLPNAVKIPIYRFAFGFRIEKGAHIGFSILDVDHLEMARHARIGHANALIGATRCELHEGAVIGFANLVRGGTEVRLGPYATVWRFNVLNSIPEPDLVAPADPRLLLGPGAFIVSGHRLDFTDRISLGKNVIVAGRNSSLWTHNRQATKPIDIGDYCYLGSEIRVAPGASLGPFSILAMGAVLSGAAAGSHIHGGVPAKPIRTITQDEAVTLRRKSRDDIPKGVLD